MGRGHDHRWGGCHQRRIECGHFDADHRLHVHRHWHQQCRRRERRRVEHVGALPDRPQRLHQLWTECVHRRQRQRPGADRPQHLHRRRRLRNHPQRGARADGRLRLEGRRDPRGPRWSSSRTTRSTTRIRPTSTRPSSPTTGEDGLPLQRAEFRAGRSARNGGHDRGSLVRDLREHLRRTG